jgi:acetyl esterase/lipase
MDLMNDEKNKSFNHVTENDYVLDAIHHPALVCFGQFILPGGSTADMRLNRIGSLLPFHNHIDTKTTVDVINYMIDQVKKGHSIFYDFYTEEEKKKDPSKESTGLFFFRGEPGAPFAIISPGGGFSYVGSIHEGFPYAREINRGGYNAFVIQYRVGSEVRATEDLAAAISFIFNHATTLDVGTEGYSLWGSSAGARMAANIGSNGGSAYGVDDLPRPVAIVMAYTNHQGYSADDPPTFVTVSANDRIVNMATVERRNEALKSVGIEVEYRKYQNADHGFGLGIGTDAEGWIESAIEFWKKYSRKRETD